MSSNRFFLKYCLQDNHWVRDLVIKPVDSVVFRKIKTIIEEDNDQNENVEMEILSEGALYKALIVTIITQMLNNPGRQFIRLWTIINLKNMMRRFKKSTY